jgi:glycogen(starch) synthase
MRILLLSWEYPPKIIGGISRVVYDLAQKLGERRQ